MTTLLQVKETCFVCSTEGEYTSIGSTNEFGSRDLDLRPAEMMRSTMSYWVRCCPSCGCCGGTVSEGPALAKELVRSPGYIAQLHDAAYPELANHFLCAGLIQAADGEEAGAGECALHAAWACDDVHSTPQADACRIKAIEHFKSGLGRGKWFAEEPVAASLMLADLYRHIGQFGEVARVCAEGLRVQPGEPFTTLLRVQQALAQSQDRQTYTIEQALDQQKRADEAQTRQ